MTKVLIINSIATIAINYYYVYELSDILFLINVKSPTSAVQDLIFSIVRKFY